MRITTTAEKLRHFGFTQADLALALGLTQPSIHRKLFGLQEWTKSEIDAVLSLVRAKYPDVTYEQLFTHVPEEVVA